MRRIALARCALAAVLFGLSAPAASQLTDDMGAFALAGLLYLGAALGVLPFAGRTPPTRAALRASLPNLSLAVVLGGAVGPVLLAAGLGLVPAATASLLLNLELVFTVAVASLLFREHLGRHVVVGTVLVVAGSAALTWSGTPDLRWGALLIAGACLCWAVDNSATAALDQLAPAHITLSKGAVAGSTNLLIGVLTTGVPGVAPVGWALVIGAFGYGASITLWVEGARDLGAARAQMVFATAPFVGAAASWLALGEPVSPQQLLAAAVSAVGVSAVLRSQHEHQHEHRLLSHEHEHTHDDPHHAHIHERGDPGRHSHQHTHEPLAHRHPHVPDLHHRHDTER